MRPEIAFVGFAGIGVHLVRPYDIEFIATEFLSQEVKSAQKPEIQSAASRKERRYAKTIFLRFCILHGCLWHDQIEEITLLRRLAHAQLFGAQLREDFRQAFCKVGVGAVRRFEICLELLAHLGRGREVRRADDDVRRVFRRRQLVLILELRLEEQVLLAVSPALRRVAVVAHQLFAGLDADELRLVHLLLLRALEKPQLRNRRGVGFGDLVRLRDRVVVPPAPFRQLVAFVGADEDNAIVFRFSLLHFAAPVSLPGTTSMMSPTSQFSALQMRSITFVATHSPFDIFVKVERATPETRCKSPRVMSRSINCFHNFL